MSKNIIYLKLIGLVPTFCLGATLAILLITLEKLKINSHFVVELIGELIISKLYLVLYFVGIIPLVFSSQMLQTNFATIHPHVYQLCKNIIQFSLKVLSSVNKTGYLLCTGLLGIGAGATSLLIFGTQNEINTLPQLYNNILIIILYIFMLKLIVDILVQGRTLYNCICLIVVGFFSIVSTYAYFNSNNLTLPAFFTLIIYTIFLTPKKPLPVNT